MHSIVGGFIYVPKYVLGIFLMYLMWLLHVYGNYSSGIREVRTRVSEVKETPH